MQNSPWKKLAIWQFLYHLLGDVFFDLDLVITGDLDRFFDYEKDKFCVIENWTQLGSGIGNTSCLNFQLVNIKTFLINSKVHRNIILKNIELNKFILVKILILKFFGQKIGAKVLSIIYFQVGLKEFGKKLLFLKKLV